MQTLHRTVTVKAPVTEVFGYIDRPANLPEIWPSLFEVKDVKTLPDGRHTFKWLYNMAGKHFQGMTETVERVPETKIVDHATGDIDSTFTWTFQGENGYTKVDFEARYEPPLQFFTQEYEPFLVRYNEYEAKWLLENLKARFESF